MKSVNKDDLEKAIKNCQEECWEIAKNGNRCEENFRKLFDHEVVLHMLKSFYKSKYETD